MHPLAITSLRFASVLAVSRVAWVLRKVIFLSEAALHCLVMSVIALNSSTM